MFSLLFKELTFTFYKDKHFRILNLRLNSYTYMYICRFYSFFICKQTVFASFVFITNVHNIHIVCICYTNDDEKGNIHGNIHGSNVYFLSAKTKRKCKIIVLREHGKCFCCFVLMFSQIAQYFSCSMCFSFRPG